MRVDRGDLEWAAREGLIGADQIDPLWRALDRRAADRVGAEGRFDLPNVAYYLGAVLVIVAMFIFMTLAWREFGGGSLLALAVVYGAVFVIAGHRLWARDDTRVAGGLLLTLAVFMVPLAVLGAQFMLGLWPAGPVPDGDAAAVRNRLMIEAAALAAGLAMIARARFTFLTVPIVAAAWAIAVDVLPFYLAPVGARFDMVQTVSILFGLGAVAVAYWVDLRARDDFAFWGYLAGLLSFWFGFSGMTLFDGDAGELARFAVAAVGLLMIGVAVVVRRPVFVVFGSLGVLAWLFDVSYGLFEDSLLFPVALSLIGLFVLWLGLRYHKRREAIEAWLQRRIPDGVRALIPPDRN